MNKKLSLFYVLLAQALLFCACSSDSDFEEKQPSFHVVKTTADMSHTGGKGTIELDTEGVKATSNESWLKTVVNGKAIELTFEPNDSYNSRTATVTLKHADDEQTVSFIQMGIISEVDVYDHTFPYTGGEKSFLWKTDQPFEIQGIQEWISYEVKGDSIVFNIEGISELDSGRKCEMHITSGKYYSKTVTFTQDEAPLSYQMLLGNYTLEYKKWKGIAVETIDVSFVEKEKDKSITMKGLDFDITVLYKADLPGIAIKSQPVSNDIWLAAWQGGYNGGGLWPNSKFGLVSQWNKDKRNIELTMIPDGVTDSSWTDSEGNLVIVHAFILWTNSGEYKAEKTSRLVDLKFIKKAE